jgi:hypothetical protein
MLTHLVKSLNYLIWSLIISPSVIEESSLTDFNVSLSLCTSSLLIDNLTLFFLVSIFTTTASISSPILISSSFNGPKSSFLINPSKLSSSLIKRPNSLLSLIVPLTISPIS